MDNLVVGALEERRINRGKRLQAFRRHSCGEGDGMLLGDAHVEATLRKALGENVQSGARRHRCRNGDNAVVPFGFGDQRLGEDLCVTRRLGRGFALLPGEHIELDDAMILVG